MSVPFYYIRPDEWWSLDKTVTGSFASGYVAGWLVDGRNGRPLRGPAGGSFSATIAGASGEVGLIALCNHNLDAGKVISLGGDLSTTLTVPSPVSEYQIPKNPFAVIDLGSPNILDTITISITGNSRDVTIGEFVAGKRRELVNDPLLGSTWTPYQVVLAAPGNTGAIPDLPGNEQGEVHSCKVLAQSLADLEAIRAWHEVQANTPVPSLIVPHPDRNDAWLVKFLGFSYSPEVPENALYALDLTFREYARSRWR